MKKEDRIKELIELWRKNNGRGRIILPNQFGKQLLLSKVLEIFLDKNPSSEVFIITQNYSSSYQWNMWLYTQKLHNKCKAYSISYILSNLSTFTKFPFLIIDDVTNEKSLYSILKIPYKFLLSITSFYDLNYLKSLPIVGEITKEEAISNKWINNYKEYKVIINVDDLDLYKEHDQKFYKYMKLFNYDLTLAMNCLSSKEVREEFSKLKNCKIELVNACTFGVYRELKWRKDFVFFHPKKRELTEKILEYNKFKRVIIFSPTIEESYKYGDILYNSKLSDKQKFEALKHINFPSPILVSAVNDISHEIKSQFDVEIITCNNSSNILKENRLKLIKEEGKIFTFVIKNTMEEAWYKLSTLDNDYITITEKMLQRVLEGKEILEERIEGPEMIFNY